MGARKTIVFFNLFFNACFLGVIQNIFLVELWNRYEADAALFVHRFIFELAFMDICLNVNHSLADGSLVWRNLVFEDTFFCVLVEKLAETRSRLSDTETGHW